MSVVKLPYYPKLLVVTHETRFGAIEISEPLIYNKPIPNKVIVRVDLLVCLQDLFGTEPFICRELLYTILAGEHKIYDASEVFASYYRKYKMVTSYVNEKYFYGDDTVPIMERSILPLRDVVNAYRDKVFATLTDAGGKYLVQTNDFLYFAYTPEARIPELKGVKVIC